MEIQNTIDSLKPEQMESGKWYFVKIVYDWLLKFDYYEDEVEPRTFAQRIISLDDGIDYTSIGSYTGGKVEKIRHATNEEVLKYFLDEKFENVSLINEVNNTQVTEQQNQNESEKVEVDWKAKFEELDAKFDALADSHSRLELWDKELENVVDEQSKLIKRLQNEIQEKESQEKVYIHYNNKQEKWLQADTLQLALEQSEENKNIYEAVKIGVKKSILVNE